MFWRLRAIRQQSQAPQRTACRQRLSLFQPCAELLEDRTLLSLTSPFPAPLPPNIADTVTNSISIPISDKSLVFRHDSIAQYTADGHIDPSFGGGLGFVETDVDPTSAALQKDGKILVVGIFTGTGYDLSLSHLGYLDEGHQHTPSHDSSIVLERFNGDGSVDSTFANNLDVIREIPDQRISTGIAIQSDGKIVVASVWHNVVSVTRLSSNGTLEPSFGVHGTTSVVFDQHVSGVQLIPQSDGSFVVSGTVDGTSFLNTALIHLLADGRVSEAYGKTANGTGASQLTSIVVAFSALTARYSVTVTAADIAVPVPNNAGAGKQPDAPPTITPPANQVPWTPPNEHLPMVPAATLAPSVVPLSVNSSSLNSISPLSSFGQALKSGDTFSGTTFAIVSLILTAKTPIASYFTATFPEASITFPNLFIFTAMKGSSPTDVMGDDLAIAPAPSSAPDSTDPSRWATTLRSYRVTGLYETSTTQPAADERATDAGDPTHRALIDACFVQLLRPAHDRRDLQSIDAKILLLNSDSNVSDSEQPVEKRWLPRSAHSWLTMVSVWILLQIWQGSFSQSKRDLADELAMKKRTGKRFPNADSATAGCE